MPASPTFAILAFYAGVLGLILFWLSAHVSVVRNRVKIMVGDKGNAELVRAMRGQANFVEFVPFCLLLMLGFAVLGAPAWVLHAMGLALVVGRICHGLHFTRPRAHLALRGVGAGLTFLVLLGGSIGVILLALPEVFR